MSCIAAGPWGGQTGTRWNDGAYSTVRQVVITTTSTGVHSIQFEYDKNGTSIWSDKHGGNSGIKIDKITLDYPTEFLVSMSGHYGPTKGGQVIVLSLVFESNRVQYGPFGVQQGVPFSLPLTGGKIVGFHGRSSWHLDSIGVYVKPLIQQTQPEMPNMSPAQLGQGEHNNFMLNKVAGYVGNERKIGVGFGSNQRIRSCGPWGGNGEMAFDDGIYTGVREVQITRLGGLVSLRVCYDQNGKPVWGNRYGGSAGLKLDKIVFDYPFEALTHISGYYGSTILRGPTIIKSITFHTTKASYGPFGDQQGFSFSSRTSGIIVGFHGRRGYFINSIGVHVLEGQPLLHQPNLDPFDVRGSHTSEVVWGMPKEPMPWGGEDGMPWDDGVYRGVKKVVLTRGEAICSIRIKYDSNGQSTWSTPHGTPNDACTYVIKFDYPYEVLTSISGYIETLFGDRQKRAVRSLTFHTNRAKYGPYGKETGVYFSSAKKEGWVVGFHGRSGNFLNAIGVHMQYRLADSGKNRRHQTEKVPLKSLWNMILP